MEKIELGMENIFVINLRDRKMMGSDGTMIGIGENLRG
jgi:hypothetical protein